MKISINQLELKTLIGVFEWERQSQMSIFADVTLEIDLDTIEDNIENTVNYFTLSQALIKRASECEYELLEALLIDLRNVVIDFDQRINSLQLRLFKKGVLKEAESTSVEIDWHRHNGK
ncbi:MAG: dihydroneopterin aldolase [Gammaproteobacteria bacterium]|nr:dihydroneopterin aldolase [Gammaproteobacteria bacterium]